MAGGGEPRPELVSAMLEPSFYPHAPPAIELRETHTSWVFLAGDLAYKVKKPVTFPFLDYGTAERRREMCREEVRLNRRLAPAIYLRVLGIAPGGERFRLVPEDEPGVIEYAVEMRRVAEERSLEALARRGELEPAHVSAVARLLAAFHAEAPVAPAERRTIDALTAPLWANLDTLHDAGAGMLGEEVIDAAEGFTRRFARSRTDELEARGRDGLVRDCHGDLRAEHVIVPQDGEPYAYDCIEFNPSLRHIDVATDLAFLVMDLARLGAEELAFLLAGSYREAGGDPGDDPQLSFNASYRAWVRSKVALLRALELERGDPERAARMGEAGELFRLGRRFAWRARRPLALVVCGVAATGKTSLSRELAQLTGLGHISSDVTRKRLAGIAPTVPADPEHYSAEFTRRTYTEMGRLAREALEREGGAIDDATFHLRSERSAFRAGLGEGAGPVLFVECRAPAETLLARVRGRAGEAGRTSDADPTIVERQLAEREPLDELPARWRAALETDAPAKRLTARVEELVDARIWSADGGRPSDGRR